MPYGDPPKQGEFRSFGDPSPPRQEGLALPMMTLPVKLVVDRESLAQFGYEIAAVVTAAVADGVREGILAGLSVTPDSSDTPTPASAG